MSFFCTVLTVSFLLLFAIPRLAEAVSPSYSPNSSASSFVPIRYVDHSVELDPTKHLDQFFQFITRPDIDAPKWQITDYNTSHPLSEGHWFLSPYDSLSEVDAGEARWVAPYIYDSSGELIWSGADLFGGHSTTDFRVGELHGETVLTVIHPLAGEAVILDQSYQVVRKVPMGQWPWEDNTPKLDMHEFALVDRGRKAVFLQRRLEKATREESATVGFEGECRTIFDGLVEIDTDTWQVAHSWAPNGVISLNETFKSSGSAQRKCIEDLGWDWLHANAIDVFRHGHYLLSSRLTSTLYKISRKSGSIVWRLGPGSNSDFTFPHPFYGQHASRIVSSNGTHTLISVLDNAMLGGIQAEGINFPLPTHSRGMLVSLDETSMRATTVQEFPHPEGNFTKGRGNMQVLPNGNIFMSWVGGCLQSEHAPDGTLLQEARTKVDLETYRAYKAKWIGSPAQPPDIHSAAVRRGEDLDTLVHMSWNGATEVKDWVVYAADPSGVKGEELTKVPRNGFETRAWIQGWHPYVVAEALDQKGNTLGMSEMFSSLAPPARAPTGYETTDKQTMRTISQTVAQVAMNPVILLIVGLVIGVCLRAVLPRSEKLRATLGQAPKLPWRKSLERDMEHLLPAIGEHDDEQDTELGSERASLDDEKRTPD